MPNTILVPLDGTPETDAALPIAAKLAREQHAEVVVLAIEHLAETSAQRREERLEEREYMRHADEVLDGLRVRHCSDTALGPAEAIIEAVRETSSDLVVIGCGSKVGRSLVAQQTVISELQDHDIPLRTVAAKQARAG